MQQRDRRRLVGLGAAGAVAVALVAALVLWSGPKREVLPPPAIPGLPGTPPLGWNSWNAYGCDVDEAKVRHAADVLASSGMRDAGYRYVVVDDCWFAPERDASGRLRADPARFPSGMRALADDVHAKGLGFGLYTGASFQTCAQMLGAYPGSTGSRGHERQDAQTFAEWGVDFLKDDWCGPVAGADEVVGVFAAMRDALRATGRPILYSINPNSGSGLRPADLRQFAGVATMTRTSSDVIPVWHALGGAAGMLGVRDAVDLSAEGASTCVTRPGSFCDNDMLVIGSAPVVVDGAATPPLTAEEERTQFAMWAMWAAPLMLGDELEAVSPQTLAMLTNPGVLAIDQDPLVRPATAVPGSGGSLWTRQLADGSTAIAMVNRDDVPRLISTGLTGLGLPSSPQYEVSDVFAGTGKRQNVQLRMRVAPHDTVLLRARAVS
ncbi:MAG: glycoside hydrolase family 27 protein [Segniliparus sp.]|uniref:glycoside hydrolase family 27 protein n=1 Tax=Segniliparus sp. TaxID=2804064 RepID=UPI003F338268